MGVQLDIVTSRLDATNYFRKDPSKPADRTERLNEKHTSESMRLKESHLPFDAEVVARSCPAENVVGDLAIDPSFESGVRARPALNVDSDDHVHWGSRESHPNTRCCAVAQTLRWMRWWPALQAHGSPVPS